MKTGKATASLCFFFYLVLLLFSTTTTTLVDSRPLGVPPVQQALSNNAYEKLNEQLFDIPDLRCAILVQDEYVEQPTTTTTTSTSTTTSTTSSTTSSTTTSTTEPSTTTSTSTTEEPSTTTTATTTTLLPTTTTTMLATTGENETSSNSTTSSANDTATSTDVSSSSTTTTTMTSTTVPTTTTAASSSTTTTEEPSSSTTSSSTTTTSSSSTTTSTELLDLNTTTTTTAPPTTTATTGETNTTSSIPPNTTMPLSFPFTGEYQVLLVTSSQVLAYRLSDFAHGIHKATPIWQLGVKGERHFVDGEAEDVRFSDPISITQVVGPARQRFPFPPFYGYLLVEKESCAIRFLRFRDNNFRSGEPLETFTVAGPNCGSDAAIAAQERKGRNAQFSAPVGITSLTSGGLLFVADDRCVRVLYDLDQLRTNGQLFNYSSPEALVGGQRPQISVKLLSGDCSSGGASDGHITTFARYFMLEHLTFDADETVLFLSQRFGFLRKIVPMPRSKQDFDLISKIAMVTTISLTLSPGTLQQLIWTNPSSSSSSPSQFFSYSSLMIVSTERVLESNSTNATVVNSPPLFLTTSEVTQLSPPSASPFSILPLPNGSALVLDSYKKSYIINPSSAGSSSSPSSIFHRFDGNDMFPGRSSHTSSPTETVPPTLTKEPTATRTHTDTFPTAADTVTPTHHESETPSRSFSYATETKPTHSDRGRSDSPTFSPSLTEHYITPTQSDSIYFFRPRSVIPEEQMRSVVNRATLAMGVISGIVGVSPAAPLLASRIVSTVGSCGCPTLAVTRIEPTLKYFVGLSYSISDDFILEIPVIDDVKTPAASGATAPAVLSTRQLQDRQAAEREPDAGSLLKQEKIVPRIRAVVALHAGTSLVIGPPFLVGIRVVDGAVASEVMPTAFRLGLLGVIVSIWIQGALAADVALLRLSPDPKMDALVVVVPHCLFCLLLVVIVPLRLSYNAMNCAPRPQLESRDRDLEDELLREKKMEEQKEKEQKRLEVLEEKRRKKRAEKIRSRGQSVSSRRNPNTTAAAAAAAGGGGTSSLAIDEAEQGMEMVNVSDDDEDEEDKKKKLAAVAGGGGGGDVLLNADWKPGYWTRFRRWTEGSLHFVPPYSESFPRSFPLVSPLVTTSPTSFWGYLFMVHVLISVGVGILDGFRISTALADITFSLTCKWYYEAWSAALFGILAVLVLILQIAFTRSRGGPFISPPASIGHLLAVFFSAASKMLQVACSFPDTVKYFGSSTDFQSNLVSVADICACIAAFGLFLICLPFFVRAFELLRTKMQNCAVDLSEASTSNHRRTVTHEDFTADGAEGDDEELLGSTLQQQNKKKKSGGGEALKQKGDLWKMLEKMERKQVQKPDHLDLLRRPLTKRTRGKNKNAFRNDDSDSSDDDDDDDDNNPLRNPRKERTLIQHGGRLVTQRELDEGQDPVFIDGCSVHAEEPDAYDALERAALLLRTEKLEKKKQKKQHQQQQQPQQNVNNYNHNSGGGGGGGEMSESEIFETL